MEDFVKIFNNLNPLKFFTENCKTYRHLEKPVSISKLTPVRFSFSAKFISNIFDNFNNIYYCFLLSGDNYWKLFWKIIESTSLAFFKVSLELRKMTILNNC